VDLIGNTWAHYKIHSVFKRCTSAVVEFSDMIWIVPNHYFLIMLVNFNFLCRMWGSHSSGYEQFYLLGYTVMKTTVTELTFWRKILSPASRLKKWAKQEPRKNQSLLPASCWFLALYILWPWRWRWHVSLKHLLTFNRLLGIISQDIKLFFNFLIWALFFLWSFSCCALQ
jgi:hypothetical protein